MNTAGFALGNYNQRDRPSGLFLCLTAPGWLHQSSQKIIDIIRNRGNVTISELSDSLGITDRAIKKQLRALKAQGLIKRIGPDKGGHWEVLSQ
ncbi:MAG TPA: hypothetical protein DCL44_10895 [Elusimicrobia bacterium]|nr:hypothetical protein [Elusimicrobiota bacterium]